VKGLVEGKARKTLAPGWLCAPAGGEEKRRKRNTTR
jgi:hypothetical protein